MRKPKYKKIVIDAAIEVHFYDYGSEKLNDRAISEIKDWIEGDLVDEYYLSISIERKNFPIAISEDYANKTKITVKERK